MHQNAIVISIRYIAVGVLLGVYPRQSIVIVTLGTILAQAIVQAFLFKDQDIEPFEMVVSMMIVFITVTAYFMSKQREAKLNATITNLISERDQILAGLPDSM